MTSAIASSVARKSILSIGIIVGKAVASTLVSAVEAGVTDALGRTTGAFNAAALWRVFFINLAVEAVTLGFAPPLDIPEPKTTTIAAGVAPSTAAVEAALGSSRRGQNLFNRFVNSGEDAITFLSRWGKGKSANNLANRALSSLASRKVLFTLEEEATEIVKKSFVGAGRAFPDTNAFEYFVDAMKSAVIKVTDPTPKPI